MADHDKSPAPADAVGDFLRQAFTELSRQRGDFLNVMTLIEDTLDLILAAFFGVRLDRQEAFFGAVLRYCSLQQKVRTFCAILAHYGYEKAEVKRWSVALDRAVTFRNSCGHAIGTLNDLSADGTPNLVLRQFKGLGDRQVVSASAEDFAREQTAAQELFEDLISIRHDLGAIEKGSGSPPESTC